MKTYCNKYLLIFLALPFWVNAQDEMLVEYQEVIQDFVTLKPISYACTVKMYDLKNESAPAETLQMNFWQTEEEQFVQMDNVESLQAQGRQYLVYHDSKEIVLLGNSKENSNTFLKSMQQLGSLIQLFELKGEKSINDHQTTIRFNATDKSKTFIEIVYDTEKKWIYKTAATIDLSNQEVDFKLDQMKVEAIYSDYKFSNIEVPISEENLLTKNGSQFKAIGKYSGYQIVEL